MMQSLCAEALTSPEAALETSFSCPTVIHFTPLLNVSGVQALSAKNPALFRLAQVFAFGTVEDLENDIPPAWLHKLRQLSLISYATQSRQLPYSDLIQRLKLGSARELEDVVIDAIYNGMVKGRLDSNNRVVLIDDWTARDVPNSTDLLPQLSSVLNNWLEHASQTQKDALLTAEKENERMNEDIEHKKKMEADIQEYRAGIEELMNRSHDIGPSTSDSSTPRTKRRGGGILGARLLKK